MRVTRRRFSYVICALLALDALLFLFNGAADDALDSAAWLIILSVFWFEVVRGRNHITPPKRRLIAALYSCGALIVAFSTLRYWQDGDALSFANSVLWIALALIIECGLHWPRFAQAHMRTFTGLAGVLFAGLALIIVRWALEKDWFDAWDATLWFIAFFTIELDLMRRFREQRTV